MFVTAAQLGQLVVRLEPDTEHVGVRERFWSGWPRLYVLVCRYERDIGQLGNMMFGLQCMVKVESVPLERSMSQDLWWSRKVSWMYEGW
jgi:hypothetical protein